MRRGVIIHHKAGSGNESSSRQPVPDLTGLILPGLLLSSGKNSIMVLPPLGVNDILVIGGRDYYLSLSA